MQVRVEGPDRWRLFKGRKLWGEFTDGQAYETAFLLSRMAEPIHTVEEDTLGRQRSDGMGWLADAREDSPRVTYTNLR